MESLMDKSTSLKINNHNPPNMDHPYSHQPYSHQKRYYAVIALVNGIETPQMWSDVNLSLGSRVVNGVSCTFVRMVSESN